MTERQEFKVLRTYEDFELREYLPCVLAEIKVSAQYSTAASAAFSSLLITFQREIRLHKKSQ
jgi:hypothetical protein